MSTAVRPAPAPVAADPPGVSRLSAGVSMPIALVVAVCAVVWAGFDVSTRDLLLFLGYAFAFTLLPGCVTFVALARPAGFGVRELAVGWGLGYALESGAFVVAAATGHRDLLPLYPVAVLVLAAPSLWTLRHRLVLPSRGGLAPAWTWGAAAVAIAAVLLTVDGFFTQTPMPATAPAVDYSSDVMAHLGYAAEALHHWPLEVPGISGLRLRYYFLANTHMASVAQITGIDLPTVVLRLYMMPLLLALVVQLVALARAVGATAWAGVVAGALVLLLGSLDPLPTVPTELLSVFPLSPSFLMGTVLWLPILILIAERLDRRPSALRLPAFAVIGLALLVAAEGAKATTLPMTMAALGLVGLWALRSARGRLPLIVGVGAACAAVIMVYNFALYHGATSALGFHPLQTYLRSEPFRLFDDRLDHSALGRIVLYPVALVLGTLRLLITLLPGLVLLGLRHRLLAPPSRLLLLGALLTGVAAMILLTHPGDSQLYFFFPGYLAGAVLSAIGLVDVLSPKVAALRLRRSWVLGSAAVLVLLLVIDMPVWDQTPKKAWGALDSVHTYPQANAGMTPELYAGYRWIRDHTATDDVFAVSTLYADKGRTDPRYCDPPAFAERRAMISCPSDGSSQFYGRLKGDQERLILNQAIFAQGSQEALDLAAKKYGVRWLVADLRHGKINPGVFSFGPVVFRNREVAVIQALGG